MPISPNEHHSGPLEPGFEEVFERFYPRVSRFFSRRGFSADRSQDLAQKTFLQVYQSWDRHRRKQQEPPKEEWEHFRRDRSPKDQETSWIFTIALNIYRNEIRRSKAQKRDAPVKDLSSLRDAGWEPTSEASSPEADLLSRQRVELLEEALRELAPGMRQCFELRFAHGLKYREIADVLEISIQSVRSQLHQARKRLEKLLSEKTDER